MQLMRRNGLYYLQFPGLSRIDGLVHGIFLRFCDNGDERRVPFDLGFGTGASDEQVRDRRSRAAAALGMNAMVFARQVHGDEVRLWPPEDFAVEQMTATGGTCLTGDALVSGEPGQALFIQTADCQSILVADPYKGVVANIHSGWRGSIANIAGAAVARMVERFGCRPQDLYCGIGPSLGPCCAEFVNYRDEIPERYWSYMLSDRRFDFWRLSHDQLAAAGVPTSRVEISHICTRCNPHLFYSYRGQGAAAGRFSAVIGRVLP